MRGAVAKWGNSLAVRLPKSLAEDVNIAEGSAVDIQVKDGSIVISPARKRYDIDSLMDEFTAEHRRPDLDWGPPVGKEVL